MKIIIWGFPLHSHTHSYIHQAWVKAFKYLEYETYWFNDDNYPKEFNYDNCIFITEGYADKNIPLNKTSTYFVHVCINPLKYIGNCKRLIDIRYDVTELNDYNYSYEVHHDKLERVGNCAYYLANANDSILSDRYKLGVDGYEAIHLSWASNYLPEEFNFDDIYKERENSIYWMGTISESNSKELKIFIDSLKSHGIKFMHNDPWRTPVSEDLMKMYTQKSFIAPDIRGSLVRKDINGKPDTGANHKYIGYIPCRIFKNISNGQLGITNSARVRDLFDGNIIYSDNEAELLDLAKSHIKDYKMIQSQMEFVRDNHTYIDRVKSIMKVYNK